MFKINLKPLAIAAIALLACTHLKAQTVKPEFKKLIHIIYEVDSTSKSKKVNIEDYVEINSLGQIHFKSIYYNGIADTTYQLADTAITKLNKIFNGSKKLTSYMVRNKIQRGYHFAGPLEYLSYTTFSGSIDSMILIEPFMDDSFNNVLNYIVVLPAKIAYKGTIIGNSLMEAQILEAQKACTYIPEIEQPPTIDERVIAAPADKH